MSDKKDYEELEDTLSTEIDEDLDPSKWEDDEDMSLSSDDFDMDDSEEEFDQDEFEDGEDDSDDMEEDDHIVDEPASTTEPKGSPAAKIILGVGLVVGVGVGGYVGKDMIFPPEPAPAPAPAFKPAPKVAPAAKDPAPVQAAPAPAPAVAPVQAEAPGPKVESAPVTTKPAIAEAIVATKQPIIASSSKAVNQEAAGTTAPVSVEPAKPSIAAQDVEAMIAEKQEGVLEAAKAAEQRAKAAENRLTKLEGEMIQMKKELELKLAETAKGSETKEAVQRIEAKQLKVIQLMARINESVKAQVLVNESQSADIESLKESVSRIEQKSLTIEGIRSEVEAMLEASKTNLKFDEKPELEVDGNKRALGFNVINSTPDGAMSVIMTPGRKVIVVFEGERVLIDGAVRKVSQIKDDGFTVIFEGGYFVDHNRVEKTEAPAPKKKAKKAPKVEEPVKEKEAQKVVQREEFADLQLVMVIDEHHFMMKTNDGVFVKVAKGDVIEGYEDLGDVKGIIADESSEEPMGILLVGEKFFIKS